MPIKTVNKFGVPVYSTGGNPGKIGILMPKRRYLYRVRVVNFGDDKKVEDLTRQVVSVSRPKVSFTTPDVHSYVSVAYYAGKHTWQSINLRLRDDITNRATRLVGQQIQKQLNFYEQTTPAAAINYKFEMFIDMLDGGNQKILEQWYLEGCFLSDVDWGDLDYSDSSPVEINLTVRYDNAQYAGEDGLDLDVFPPTPTLNFPGESPGLIA